MTKTELIASLERERQGERSYLLTDVADLEYGRGNILVAGNEFLPTEWAMSQVLRKLRIPKGLWSDLSEPLSGRLFKHQRGLVGAEPLKLRVRDDTLTAALPVDYAEVKAEDLLALLPEWEYRDSGGYDLDSPVMWFRAVSPIDIGDRNFHGFNFALSEVGGWPFIIDCLIWTEICSNGLLRRRASGGPYFELEMTALEGAAFEVIADKIQVRLQKETASLKKALEQGREDEIDVNEIIDIWSEMRIPKAIPQRVGAALAEEERGPTMSRFDLASIVSNVGSSLAYRTRVQFEYLAGSLLNIQIKVPAN